MSYTRHQRLVRRLVGLQVNAEKTKHTFKSHHQNTRQNCYEKIPSKSFKKSDTEFKYLVMTAITQNYIQKKLRAG
jgi:hypothetical protein